MELAQTIILTLNFLAIVTGGVWAYYRTVLRREHAVKLDFAVNVNFVGVQGDVWLVSLDAIVNNIGEVRHTIRRFEFDLRYLGRGDPIRSKANLGGQVEIPHELVSGSWLPREGGSTFVEPSAKTVYSFVSSVPIDATYVLLHGLLDYDEAWVHTADKLIAVPGGDERPDDET